MITNDRQYRITRAAAKRFREALTRLGDTRPDDALGLVERAAVESQLHSLDKQLAEYEELRDASTGRIFRAASLTELPNTLIQARIASGMTQRQLADALNLKEQQIQRYEANNYSGASINRLDRIAEVLGVVVQPTFTVGVHEDSVDRVLQKLGRAGFASDVIKGRLTSNDLSGPMQLADLARKVEEVFRIPQDELLSRNPVTPDLIPALVPRFKLPARASETRLITHSLYAHYLVEAVLAATPQLEQRSISGDWQEFLRDLDSPSPGVEFGDLVRHCWNRGIVVLPLRETGSFHAACWKIEGRAAIVLKQAVRSDARWTFDLLHEYYHVATSSTDDLAMIEDSESSLFDPKSHAEILANEFAGNVVLDGQSEALAQEAVGAANGKLERLKSATVRIAESNGLDPGILANYLAWRLSLQGEDWWGAATNLQARNTDPWSTARDILLSYVELERLEDVPRELLIDALSGDSNDD